MHPWHHSSHANYLNVYFWSRWGCSTQLHEDLSSFSVLTMLCMLACRYFREVSTCVDFTGKVLKHSPSCHPHSSNSLLVCLHLKCSFLSRGLLFSMYLFHITLQPLLFKSVTSSLDFGSSSRSLIISSLELSKALLLCWKTCFCSTWSSGPVSSS